MKFRQALNEKSNYLKGQKREPKFLTFAFLKNGDLSEWSNEQAWKVCIRVTVSRVRISQSPLKTQRKSVAFFM